MPKRTRVLVMGLGYLGRAVARTTLSDARFKLVGLIESDPDIASRTAAELLDDPRVGRLPVRTSLADAPKADVVVMTTRSRFREIAPEVLAAVKRGLHVVSSCEEIAHPWSVDDRLARRIDRAAKSAGVAVLGTGVNPGYALDRFALSLAGTTIGVERVLARRVVDLSTRRSALRHKLMVGQSPSAFRKALTEGTVGHVGLEASARLVADGMGWASDHYAERIEPVLASEKLRGPGFEVPPGHVAGVIQEGALLFERIPRVLLHLEMAVDVADPHDAVLIEAPTPVRAKIDGGLPGETTTVAMLLRGAMVLVVSRPGIVTVADLPSAPSGGLVIRSRR